MEEETRTIVVDETYQNEMIAAIHDAIKPRRPVTQAQARGVVKALLDVAATVLCTQEGAFGPSHKVDVKLVDYVAREAFADMIASIEAYRE